MKIHDVQQGSVEWGQLRAGVPTASEFDNLVTPLWKIRTGEMPRTYLATKVAEAWLGGPLMGSVFQDMDQGKMLEEEALPWLELELETAIDRVGFVTRDDGRVGCSPDGLVRNHFGVEIKCPQPTQHVKNLLNGAVPGEYLAQIYGGMYVTGLEEWKFLSYRRGFPKLLVTVKRDEEIMDRIHEALFNFLAEFDRAMKCIIDMNGGPPKRHVHQPIEHEVYEQDEIGVTP